MRVMIVHQHFPPEFIGGSERNVQSLARELAALGDEVSIVARSPAPSPRIPMTVRERLPDDSRLYRLRGGQFAIESFLHHHQHIDREFTLAMLEQKPEVVHFHHLASLSPAMVEIAVNLGAGVVVSLHDFYLACPTAHLQKRDGTICAGPDGGRACATSCFADEQNPLARWSARADYFKLILSLAHRVVCHSEYVAGYFEKYGLPRSRVRILPIGVQMPGEQVPAQAIRSSSLSLAFCGSVLRLKGPHVILQALQQAEVGNVKLSMLGPTPDKAYAAELKDLARGISGLTLLFHGPYNWSELTTLLAGVDCVVSPSLVAETFGMVPREALAHGIPVAVARLGALPEVVREGENGFTFDPADPLELARIFNRLVNETDLLPRLRRRALATRIETPVGHAKAIQAVYREATDPAADRGRDQSALLAAVHQQHQALLKLGFQ